MEIMKASAGSGKTYSLTRKYISLLLENRDRYAYRHILAVTFTNKATDEMKERILKELYVLSVSPATSGYHDDFVPSVFPSDEDLRKKSEAVLHDILHDYSSFSVSTIDRFFQQTLKAFSREIGQFASYQVELDRKSLVHESVERILDSLTEDDSVLLSWLTENVLEQIETGGRYSMDANLMDMAERLMSSQRSEAMEEAGLDDSQAYARDRLKAVRGRCREIISDFRKNVKEKAAEALGILNDAGIDVKDTRNSFMKYLYDYRDLEDGAEVPFPKDSLMNNSADPELWFSKAKAKTLLPKVYPFMEAPLNDFRSLFDKDYAVYCTAVLLDNQLYGLGVADELGRTFNELMKEKNVLCIDDSNTILRNIIDGSDAPFIYEKTGVRYDHYLLDEFQDTSKVQWQNFSPLLKESESRGGRNLIVGDVKQSIYRWRGSDWKLLQSVVPRDFPDHKETVLDTNFRSLSNIVAFNNAFFKAAARVLDGMSVGAGESVGMIYSDVEQEAYRKIHGEGSVSLTFCDRNDELRKVLDSVKEACSCGATLSEIAVLVRSNRIGEEVAAFLMENGIPVVTDDSLRVKGSMTVRRLSSLMSLADNPSDTVNGYLAESLDIEVPQACGSLTDMAESLLRSLKNNDPEQIWKGEILHIQSFMDYLQDYVNTEGNSLRGFLKAWEEADPSICSPSSGECVRVMTIHKSKGLAFPYVIIPFAENINLYKADNRWCSPEMEGTPLEGVAEGVYDVSLNSASEKSLFSKHFFMERFLQHVDNMNTIYVAMTRPALGMHIIAKTPPATCLSAVDSDDTSAFKDFSQILYWFVSGTQGLGARRSEDEGALRFDIGEMPDFPVFRKQDASGIQDFDISGGDGYPSFPLNAGEGDADIDVRERGRLKFSAESVDFFSDEGEAGISASNRIRGVVLHDVLAGIKTPADMDKAGAEALASGVITQAEYDEVMPLLRERLGAGCARGWFPESAEGIMNEVTLIDTDGGIYRPDRVMVANGKVTVIDYKFGEHYRKYERQLRKYADIWKRMGYAEVEAWLWYVHTDEVMRIV